LGEPLSLRSVWLVSSADVWSVSAEGFILHWDGATWTTMFRARHALSSVWASSTEVWAAGERGLVLHWTTGGEWTRIEPGHVEDIAGIYVSSANDVWFGHDSGLDHFDGTTLTTYPVPIPKRWDGQPVSSGLGFGALFGRPGFETYAAYATCPTCTGGYVFELQPGAITEITSSALNIPFAPRSGVVTDAPDDDHRIFVFGYYRAFDSSPWKREYRYFGKTSTRVWWGDLGDTGLMDQTPPRRPIPSWPKEGGDVRVQTSIGVSYRWDSTDGGFVLMPSIDMGHDFVPRTVFAVHGNETETWLVGDGFALKGPTQ
jgi:hypothetical protein